MYFFTRMGGWLSEIRRPFGASAIFTGLHLLSSEPAISQPDYLGRARKNSPPRVQFKTMSP